MIILRLMLYSWLSYAAFTDAKWIKCRTAYINSRILADGGLCEECRDKSGYIVHHKVIYTPENISNPEIALNHEHLEYVCKDCHDLFEGHGLNKPGKPLCILEGTDPGAETAVGDKKQLFRVQVGAYAVEANSAAMLAKLKAAGFDDAIIVKA